MGEMKPVAVVKPRLLSAKDKERLTKAGYCVIESDDLECIKKCRCRKVREAEECRWVCKEGVKAVKAGRCVNVGVHRNGVISKDAGVRW